MAYKHFYIDKSVHNKALLESNPILIYSGFVSQEPNWYYIEHSHPFCEIVYICDGRGEFIIDGKAYTACKGDLLIYNTGVLHEERSDPSNPLKTYFCAIENVSIDGINEGCIIPENYSPIISTGDYAFKLESYITDLVNESSAKILGYEMICSNLLSSIIILILRIAGIQNDSDTTSIVPNISKNIKDYIDNNYTYNLNLSDLAKNLYISKDYVSHVFKNKYGFSPINYLVKRRIEEAKKLLDSSNLSVNEISVKVGYDDPNYFSVIFKKLTGFSPLQYRKFQKK